MEEEDFIATKSDEISKFGDIVLKFFDIDCE